MCSIIYDGMFHCDNEFGDGKSKCCERDETEKRGGKDRVDPSRAGKRRMGGHRVAETVVVVRKR